MFINSLAQPTLVQPMRVQPTRVQPLVAQLQRVLQKYHSQAN